MTVDEVPASRLVDAHGRPARAQDQNCPRCGAPPSKRISVSGFGNPPELCGICGYQFGHGT